MTRPEALTPKIEPADEALNRLVNSKIYLFGHGTPTQEWAASSIADGLHTRHTDLFSTAAQLPVMAEDPDAFERNKATLAQWPHHDAQYVVALGVERLEGEAVPHRRYLQSIVQPREGAEDVNDAYGAPYAINRRFIAGYFDAAEGTFTNNPDFDPHYDPALLETTVNQDIERELHPN